MERPQSLKLRLVGAVVVLSLLLGACGPGLNYVQLSSEDPVAQLPDGVAVSANPAELPRDFRVQLVAVPADKFVAGEAGTQWLQAAGALPTQRQLSSPVYAITTQGGKPPQMFVSVALPPGTTQPVGYDLYAWNGAAWEFLPAQARGEQLVATVAELPPAVALFAAPAGPPLAFVAVEPGQAFVPAAAGVANAVLLGGGLVQADGSLAGQLPGVAAEAGYGRLPVVRSEALTPSELIEVLADSALRTRHLEALLGLVVGGGYDGLLLDYAGVTPEMAPAFAQFVHDLAQQLHGHGRALLVQVGPAEPAGDAFNTGGYDWRALGAAADGLVFGPPADPRSLGNGQADALVAWAVGEVPRERLRLLVEARSLQSVDGAIAPVGMAEALAPMGAVALDSAPEALAVGEPIRLKLSGAVHALAFDPEAQAATFTDQSQGQTRTVWLTSAATLRQRLALAEAYQLGGVAVAGLGASGAMAELAAAVTEYKVRQAAAPAEAQAQVLWSVRGATGLMAEATAQPGEPFVFTAPAAGAYEFSAGLAVGGAQAPASLGSLAVQVAAVETPTPEPTATATQAPAGGTGANQQPTAAPSTGGTAVPTAEPTVKPPTGGGGPPPPPVSGGPFELGGQVPGFISHAAQMQEAGMRWVKFQVRGGGADLVAAGHGAGFKVLLSVIGDKSRVTDPAYMDEYAAWVGGLAGAGADAIEVWNEPNIDHEWPEGQISAAAYTQLLAKAYAAIKGANGGTIVISGGPAPTGAEGAFPGRVINDDRFVREMAAAGAANYMDCVGIHYNTGTTSPNATTGAALSGYHYSYYFWPMVDTYYNAFGGARPLCFTELGYLTPEGYGGLPGNFAWASDTSLAEQAQWLAEAASLGGNSGKVRLMMVWNVDFTYWGGDPQAGYAIVRADGSCPACAALGNVVP